MSQAHTTFVGYFLGYQGLEKEPEAFVSKPPQWKFSSARNSEETPSEGVLTSGGFRGVERGQSEGTSQEKLSGYCAAWARTKKLALETPLSF